MNVLILEDSSKAFFGGGQRVTLEVIRCLKDTYSLVVFDCGRQTVFSKEAERLTGAVHPLLSRGKISKGISTSFSMGWGEVLFTPFWLVADIVRVHRTICRLAGKQSETVIYASTKKVLLIAWGLKLWKKYRYVFHAHSVDNRDSIFFRIIQPALKNADRLICVSRVVAENYGLPQSVVIYNPAPEAKIRMRSRVRVVAIFASLLRLKGGDVFARAAALVDDPSVEFRVYGTGPEYDNIAATGGSKICMMGFCKDVPREIETEVDLVVVPSIAPEAFGMTIAEAFSRGIPVITTNIGGQAELVEHERSGLLVEPGSAEKLADAIRCVLDCPQLYRQLSEGAAIRSRLFSRERFREQVLGLFGNLFQANEIQD